MLDVAHRLSSLSVGSSDAEFLGEEFLSMVLEVATISQEIGAMGMYRLARGNLAVYYAVLGEYDEAASYLGESLRWLRTAGAPSSWTGFQALVASSVYRSRGDFERAAELAGAGEALATERATAQYNWTIPERRWRDENREALRAALGDDFDRVFQRGATLTSVQAIDLASGRRAPGGSAPSTGVPR